MWITIVFGVVAALFLLITVATLVHQRSARRLPARETVRATRSLDSSTGGLVRCSVVVAARDAEARLEGTVRHLLAQEDVSLDVIVIDDRSTDRTGEILRRLASEDPRVQVRRVEVLPDGWLGKCHACHVGAGATTGEWILFTDADCWLKPDVIARALGVADRAAADHITLTPGVVPDTWGARAWHLVFLSRLSSWISAVNRDRAGAYFGIGAFNLVRASAYRECGGYEALRMTVLDDVKLGLLLHRARKRTRAFIGGDDMACHWGMTVPGLIAIMEKNYFAAIDYRVAPVAAAGLMGTLLFGSAAIGPWTGTIAGMAAGLAAWSLALPAAVFARRLGWPLRYAVMTPLMYPVMVYAVINSAVVTLQQGGVRWRDTFYSLDTLRKGTLR